MSDSSRPRSSRSGSVTSASGDQRWRLSLIPILETFGQEMLHSESRSSGPPTITVTEPEREAPPQGNATETTGSIILGRNPDTQIAGAADFVSRRLVQIMLERTWDQSTASSSSSSASSTAVPPPKVVVQPLKELRGVLGHQLHLNGEKLELDANQRRTLHTGDVLALFDKHFQYKIKLEQYPIVLDLSDDEDESDDQKVAAAAVNGSKEEGSAEEQAEKKANQTKSPGRRAKESMKMSMECPLCSEILSNAQSLSCGHALCGECAIEYGVHAFLGSQKELSSKPVAAAAAADAAEDGTTSSQSEEFHTAKEHHSEGWSGPANMEKCPTCQKPIEAIYPNFCLNSVITGQVMSGEGEFDLYDLKVYLKKQGKSQLTEGEARSIFRKHPMFLSEYLEGLKKEASASASTTKNASAASTGAAGMSIGEGKGGEEEPQKKKARPSENEIVIEDEDDNEEEDAKSGSHEIICIDV